MKISWGYKIAILYCSFAAFIAVMVVKASTLNDDLVTKDYYEAEMKYQQRIDQIKKSKALSEPVVIKYEASTSLISVDFPEMNTPIEGSALLFRPSDAKQDKLLKLNIEANSDYSIPAKGLEKGLWRLEVEWNANGTTYYDEEVLFIP